MHASRGRIGRCAHAEAKRPHEREHRPVDREHLAVHALQSACNGGLHEQRQQVTTQAATLPVLRDDYCEFARSTVGVQRISGDADDAILARVVRYGDQRGVAQMIEPGQPVDQLRA